MKKNKIYFRADGNAQMGLGHINRSLALAQMLNNHFSCHFIIQTPLSTVKKQILEICDQIIELNKAENLIDESKQLALLLQSTDIIVLDGYYFTTAYQKELKNKNIKLVCIDDIHSYHFVADAVINYAPNISEKQYSIEPYTKLFLGLNYALLRKPFLESKKNSKEYVSHPNIFICFGGSDYQNITQKVIKALIKSNTPIAQINVVIGAAGTNYDEICAIIRDNRSVKINLFSNASASKMHKLMQESNVAIVPASTISFEAFACNMKLICGYYVDNQKEYHDYLHKRKLAFCVGNYLTVTESELAILIELGIQDKHTLAHNPIDKKVSFRLLEIFKNL